MNQNTMKTTKKYLFFILSLVVGFSTSCSKEEEPIIDNEGLLPKPTATFNYEVVDVADPFTIKFNNASTNFIESRWSFADDSTSSETSPTHTFLKTGTFNVKLITLNEEGYWAQREEKVEILPSDLVQLKTSVTGSELQVGYDADFTIGSTEWFVKQSDGKYQSISEDDIMSITIPIGEFRDAYVQLKTPKQSVIRVNMQLMSTGIVKDLTLFNNQFSVSHDNDGGKEAGEGSLKLIDGSIDSKFLIFNIDRIGGPFYWQFDYIERQVINGYTIATGNDAPGRDPKDWDLMASNDGENWVTLHSVNGHTFPTTGGPKDDGRKATYTFTFDNSTPYHLYKLQVRAVGSGTLFQMAEFRMLQLPQ